MIIHDVVQGSIEWLNLRKGVVTGTKGKLAKSANNLTLVDAMIAELGSDEVEDTFVSFAMKHGVDTEPIARESYELKYNCKVDQVGFCTHDFYEWAGYSTDGFIMIDGKYKKGIEIKCPNTSTHVKYIRMGKIPSEYLDQIIHGFFVNEDMESLDFISYDYRFKPRPMLVLSVTRAELTEQIEAHKNELIKFHLKFEKYYNEIVF